MSKKKEEKLKERNVMRGEKIFTWYSEMEKNHFKSFNNGKFTGNPSK